MMHEALLQTPEGDRVRCGLCPHACLIAEGKRGICGARGVVDGHLQALTYGLVSSVAADPIEKKPVFHYCPGTKVLSFGSVGCSLRCGHCQNWQISRPPADEAAMPLRYVDSGAVVAMAHDAGCEGVAFTYNEPVIWLEWVLDVAREAKRAGLYTVMVTNGYVTPAGLDLFAEVIDVWRVDIKGFAEDAFKRLCHAGHAEAVRAMAVRAKKHHGMHVECVTNVVPTINDSDSELTSIAQWIAVELGCDTPWHVTRFVPYLEFADLPPTPVDTLLHAQEIGKAACLDYVYLGNVDVPGGEDTTCPSCGHAVVRRRYFGSSHPDLDAGACPECGAQVPIVTREP
ncbi:MAG TPA: AmmeMemoRadiSam system radical SAM enzyme [Coriobacteriia bacterium]|nr:AmmeMemoRadiSam system radical SAM enzyme [Coriobacteriia bacterium]